MPTDETWHILTVAEEGTASILKNLTYEQAREVMQRIGSEADPWCEVAVKQRAAEATDTLPKRQVGMQQVFGPGSPSFRPYFTRYNYWEPHRSVGFKQVECWGPAGAEMVIWPKPDDYEARYQIALKKAMAEKASHDEARELVERTNAALRSQANANR